MEQSVLLAGKAIGAGLAMIGALGGGIGIGLSVQWRGAGDGAQPRLRLDDPDEHDPGCRVRGSGRHLRAGRFADYPVRAVLNLQQD